MYRWDSRVATRKKCINLPKTFSLKRPPAGPQRQPRLSPRLFPLRSLPRSLLRRSRRFLFCLAHLLPLVSLPGFRFRDTAAAAGAGGAAFVLEGGGCFPCRCAAARLVPSPFALGLRTPLASRTSPGGAVSRRGQTHESKSSTEWQKKSRPLSQRETNVLASLSPLLVFSYGAPNAVYAGREPKGENRPGRFSTSARFEGLCPLFSMLLRPESAFQHSKPRYC